MGLLLLRALLFVAAIPPLVLGLTMVLSPTMSAAIAGVLSNAKLEDSPEHRLGVISTGGYVVFFGGLLFWTALSPQGQRPFVTAGGILFLLRGFQRLVRAGDLQSAYGVDGGKNLGHAIYLVSVGAALILFAPCVPPADHFDGTGGRMTQAILALVGVQSVVTGASLALEPRYALSSLRVLLGARRMPRTAQFEYIVQPLGVYMLGFGIWFMAVAPAPQLHPRAVAVVGVFLLSRAALRMAIMPLACDAFGLSRSNLLAQAAGLAALGGLLLR